MHYKTVFDLGDEGQDQGWDLHHSTGHVQIHIGVFFRILATWQHTFTQKVTHKHTARNRHADLRQNAVPAVFFRQIADLSKTMQ